MLRGLADLVFPDPREAAYPKDDTRFFITETMEALAAQIAGDEFDGETWPSRFAVHVRKGAGKRGSSPKPATPARQNGGPL